MSEQPDPPPDPAALARDWITIIESELAALAVDRELQEAAQRLVRAWATAARTLLGHDGAAGPARAAAAARPSPAAPAPGARDAELERLRARIVELESRLAALERGS